MKKLFLFALILILSLTSFSLSSVTAKISIASNQSYYAKVQQEGVYFYSLPYDESENRLFEIPATYFVLLTANANDYFFSATYQDLEGYVKKNEVVAMEGTPIKPFPNSYFRVYATDGLGIYLYPNSINEYKIDTIPYLTENITYYGQIQGEEFVPDKSNIWYYCKYNGEKSIYGYVSSVFCDQLLPKIETNYESFPIITTPSFSNKNSPNGGLSKVAMTFIIIGVSLPCLVVFYLLIKPSWMKDKVLNEKPKLKRKRHGDYFEFDENDLN